MTNSDIYPPTARGWSQEKPGAPPNLVYITRPPMSDKLPGFFQCGCTKDCKPPYKCITERQAEFLRIGAKENVYIGGRLHTQSGFAYFLCYECLFVISICLVKHPKYTFRYYTNFLFI